MKKVYLLLILLVVGLIKVEAQGYSALYNSNYSPTNTVYFNPASIADGRQKFQLNILSANIYANTNVGNVTNMRGAIFNGENLNYQYSADGKNKSLDAFQEVRLPSFVASLNQRQSIGFGFRTRGFVKANQFPSDLAGSLLANETMTLQSNVLNNAFANNIDVFSEVHASYGAVLFDNGAHVLKGGITAKYLMGAGSSRFNNRNLDYSIANVSAADNYQVTTRNVDVALASSGIGSNFDHYKFKWNDLIKNTGKGFGADLGLEYEWRPNYESRNYQMDGKKQIDRSMIPYKLKVGAAITDIGTINYKRDDASSYAINSNTSRTFNRNQIDENNLEASLKNIYGNELSASKGMKMYLPTTLNFNVDYNINNRFFVAANLIQGITNPTKTISNFGTLASVIPRFETRRFGVSVPVSYVSRYSDKVNVGLGLRAGFFFIGTDDIKFLVTNKKVSSANIYAGFNFTIPNRRLKDRDGDGVSDKFDKCPDLAGTAENHGCPWNDADGDGIPDKDDLCPDQAGPAITKGCPDKDGDGIPDKDDECPDQAGTLALKGCPDRDGDGIADKDDKCPDQAGPASNGGCPVVKQIKKVVTLTKVEEKVIFTAVQSLQFDLGKSTIKKYSYSSLNDLAKLLNDKTNLKLSLSGHTDNTGSAALNKKLSQARAGAVKKYLVNKGVDATRITAIGYGLERPIVSNKTADGRAKNRRVEFKVE